jgi:phage-related protein (TIGR01555 family)
LSKTRRHNSAPPPATQKVIDAAVQDTFQNFMAGMGLGTDNINSASTYGFNPVTRNRTMLEWIHRGSWVGGVAIDVIADDMTRAGIELQGIPSPADVRRISTQAVRLGIWKKINEGIKWGRLYGGAIIVMLIDGQDMATPLIPERVGPGQFRGLAVVDRWYAEPRLDALVQEFGPMMGMPEYYEISTGIAGLARKRVHYSRVIRMDGIPLPFNQRMQENLWGISVLERLYDRMVAFDSATTGAAQLVYKSYIRTLKIQGYKEMVGENGPATAGLYKYVEMMRRFQSVEGINVMDQKDTVENMPAPGFSGLSDVIFQFGQQLAGALQVPLVRLFGQSPAGLSSTGESDIRNYYDGILQRQEEQLHPGVVVIYQLLARSEGVDATDLDIKFRPLWQNKESEKAEMARRDSETVDKLFNSRIISRGQALRELRHQSAYNGHFGAITDEEISQAEDEPEPAPEAAIPEPEAEPARDAATIRAAGIVYLDPDGCVLLLKRSAGGDHPGEWAFPAGHIEPGEGPLTAATREFHEETGRPVAATEIVGQEGAFMAFGATGPRFPVKESSESTGHVWARPSELPAPMHPVASRILERHLARR